MEEVYKQLQSIYLKHPEAAQACQDLEVIPLSRYFLARGLTFRSFNLQMKRVRTFISKCANAGDMKGLQLASKGLLIACEILSFYEQATPRHFCLLLSTQARLALDMAMIYADKGAWPAAIKSCILARERITSLQTAMEVSGSIQRLSPTLTGKWLYLACEFTCRRWLLEGNERSDAVDPYQAVGELRNLSRGPGEFNALVLTALQVAKLCMLLEPKLVQEAIEELESRSGVTMDSGWRLYEQNRSAQDKLCYYPYIELSLWRELIHGRADEAELQRLHQMRDDSLVQFYGVDHDLSSMRASHDLELKAMLAKARRSRKREAK